MIIQELEATNYRVLNGIKISFSSKSSYIVGRNNIGKTSTLDLLSTILSGNSFKQSDFFDETQPIIINVVISLSSEEVGVFDDNFDSSEEGMLRLKFVQTDPVSPVEISAITSRQLITKKQIQTTNYIGFSSNRKPVQENDLTRQTGNYKLIPYLVKMYAKKNQPEIVKSDEDSNPVIDYVNNALNKIKPFRDNEIRVDLATNYVDYITRALKVQNTSGVDFSELGFGTQFSSLIPLVLIDQLISWSRYNHLDDHLFIDNEGGKELHFILGLDEPEVHLHPNLQFSIREDIESLLSGEDQKFNQLVKAMFNIDKITGQMIVVTHSPYILSNNYHEYIRYSQTENGLTITSGKNLDFNVTQQKQLMMQLPNVKSALFADTVVLVEGETEFGAFPVFAEELGLSLAQSNVNVVNAGGIKSTSALKSLFSTLGISCLSIIDRDDGNESSEDVFVTSNRDFEFECFECMNLENINEYLKEYYDTLETNKYDGSFWDEYLDPTYKTERIEKLRNDAEGLTSYIEETVMYYDKRDKEEVALIKANLKEKFIRQFLKKKSVLNGAIIAHNLEKVPDVYQSALKEALK